MVPGLHVAPRGLPEQDVVHIGPVGVQAGGQRGHDHRCQPQRHRQQKPQRRQPEADITCMQAYAWPVQGRCQGGRYDHQQGQHAHTLGDHPDAGKEPAQPPPAPGRAQQQVAQQAVVGQRDEQHQQRVDLCLLRLEGEVQREQQRPAGIQPDPPCPQAPAKIHHAPQRAQRGQQRRQQEGHAPVADQAVQRGLPPHQHRRLVRVEFQHTVRKQPVAAVDHLPGHQSEAWLVRRPWITKAETGPQHQQGHHHQQPRLSRGTCVEETVSIVVTWQALACHAFAIHAECGAQRLRLGIRMPLEKRAHLVDVLGTQDRAGRIQQHAARAQHRPAGFQQARLHSHQRIDVLGAAVEHDIRLAADHAGGRTRCIQQDRVERHAIPPGTGIAGISGQGLRVFAHAGTGIGVTGARQAPGVDIQRQQSQARVAFQQVRRFATGRCAGIQDARAGSGGQCIRRTLRRQVLHRQRAVGEAGQLIRR
ncbi:hypothetical protein G6F65_015408 [Rhizopus arrhizus]|nr:hypothetical protein G6F65_015408 [Rhizopus arrhizus]